MDKNRTIVIPDGHELVRDDIEVPDHIKKLIDEYEQLIDLTKKKYRPSQDWSRDQSIIFAQKEIVSLKLMNTTPRYSVRPKI